MRAHPHAPSRVCWSVNSKVRMTRMRAELMVRWELHPDRIVTHTFPLREADATYRVADAGHSGKVSIVMTD
jgi:threonine dehydrogenase-like Zn-dependent dehydrogenase